MPVSISTVVWGSTVWWTMQPVRESASVWSTASHTTNLYVDLMENSTRTTVSCTEPRVLPGKESPLYTARNASTKVRKKTAFTSQRLTIYRTKKCPYSMWLVYKCWLSMYTNISFNNKVHQQVRLFTLLNKKFKPRMLC